MRAFWVALFFAACSRSSPPASMPASAPVAREVAVRIEGMTFAPSGVQANVGDTLVFTNTDLVPHTASAKDGAFDSGTIDAGKAFRWKAERAGTFPFVCKFHPTMSGVVSVH